MLPVLPAAGPTGPDEHADLVVDGGCYLVLGGTGGIGSSIAAWLLDRADCRLLLLARDPKLPHSLAEWADRIELMPADLAAEPVEAVLDRLDGRLDRLDGVVHAAGAATGSLIARRDAAAMRQAGAAKLNGGLLVEGLIQRYQPAFAAYCSSMSALFGGIGQLDYAAGNGLLDGFAHYRADPAEATVRLGIDWDIWAEVGMARHALRGDPRHQAHLAVGLTVAEGQQVFAQALRLQLPQLLVSTTALEQAGSFYAPPADEAHRHPETHRHAEAHRHPETHRHAEAHRHPPELPGPAGSVAEQLADCLCRWLGVDELDPAASLYDLGADSLVLLDLIGEIKQRFGVDIELARLSHRASLAEVLAQYEAITGTTAAAEPAHPAASATAAVAAGTDGTDLVRLDVWQHGTGSDLLCLIHPVGGDIQAYRSLVSLLDPGLTVCLIADPALYRPELPPWPLADRARRYAEALRARFPRADWRWRLAGWSFGAWVALAMAAEGEAAGQPVAGLYLLDPPPPGSGQALQSYDEDQLRTVFALELGLTEPGGHSNGQVNGPATSPATSQANGQRPDSGEAAAYAERLARCCRTNLASMADYQLPGLTETPVELWLAGVPVPGLPQHGSAEERQQLWQALLPGLAGCHLVEASHDGIVRLPAVRGVASVVNAASRPVFS
jgi:thioesterase domain-containing protein/acyl carrier protein